ncbi:PTS sugar transporter subunit IIA [Paracoccus sp. PXZ]|uniref:PTS sugar transporter subunit IIA n=1 Tax=Pseudochrobactrum sp. B5 TaxID=1289478 RepID=UPI0009F92E0D|nr:PTS sugar transporter subunit IIA [Pseudochrobactrum sp. B5]
MKQTVIIRISDLLTPQDIEVNLDVPTKSEALDHLASRASAALGIDKAGILSKLHAREALGSTGVGSGVALPHSADVAINAAISCGETDTPVRPYVALARLARPVEFDALDTMPVDIVFLMLTPKGNTAEALRILAAAARILRSPRFCAALRKASTGSEAYAALVDEELFSGPSGDGTRRVA